MPEAHTLIHVQTKQILLGKTHRTMLLSAKWKKSISLCIFTLLAAVTILTTEEEFESDGLSTPVAALRGRRHLDESDIQQKVTVAAEGKPPQHVATVLAQTPQTISDERSAIDQSTTTDYVKSVYMDAFRRWNHPLRARKDGSKVDVPVFWRIPQAGSDIVEDVMSVCYGLSLASGLGAIFEDENLREIQVPSGPRYINVDVSNPEGIKRAVSRNLGSSGLADVISSSFLFETTALFQSLPESGRCFTMLKHPVARAISLYHRFQKNDEMHAKPAQYQGFTIEEFAKAQTENNWMVRFLTGKRSGALSFNDLEVAKQVLGGKCIIGLSDEVEQSILRFDHFFQWTKRSSDSPQVKARRESCLSKTLSNHAVRNIPTYEGTNAWEVLKKKNTYDILLYEFAKKVYSQQSVLFRDIDR